MARPEVSERHPPHAVALFCIGTCRRVLRVFAAASILALLLGGMMFLALKRGPVPIPGLASFIEARFEQINGVVSLDIGRVEISLDPENGEPLIQASGVELADRQTAQRLLAVPSLAARLSSFTLLSGGIAPTEIVITGAQARLVRQADGRFGFDFGAVTTPAEGEAPTQSGFAIIDRILDGMVGDGPARPATQHLARVEIRDAHFLFRNAATGAAVRVDGARFVLDRAPDRLVGRLTLPVIGANGERTRITAEGRRRRGEGSIAITAGIEDLRIAGIAGQIREIAWLAPFDAPVSGTLSARVGPSGGLFDINADLAAGAGAVVLEGEALGFDALHARVAYAPETGRLRLSRIAIDSEGARTDFAGQVTFETDEAGAISGLFADLHAGETRLVMPQRFDAPVTLNSVDASFRARFSPLRVEIADFYARRGALSLNASGKLAFRGSDDRLAATLRVAAQDMTVADLKALWPEGVGGNARAWAQEHLVEGHIPAMLAQVRLDGEEPDLTLDFNFRDVVADVLDGMPAIEGGVGEAQVRLNDMVLGLSAGRVTPVAGQPIDLQGSHLRIFDFDAPVTPADIRLRATGPIDAVLALIDRRPLGLVSKLGLPIGRVDGSAQIRADLAFPLLKDLPIEDVDVAVDATLRDVAGSLPLPDMPVLPVAADRLALTGSTAALSLTGPIRIADNPFDLTWNERFDRPTTDRLLGLDGRFDDALLATLGVEQGFLTRGSAAVALSLREAGGTPPRGTLDLDLAAMGMKIPGIAWSKPPGVPATASMEILLAEVERLERLRVQGGGLDIEGSGDFDATGALSTLSFERFVVGEAIDITLAATREAEGLRVSIGGNRLDVDVLAPGEEGGGGLTDVEAAIDLNEMVLVPEVVLLPARGRLILDAEGGLSAIFEGRVNGFAAISGSVTLPSDGAAGQIAIEAADAGAFLRATGLATEAQGGKMRVVAALQDGDLDDLSGQVRMTDVQMTESSVLSRVLRRGDSERQIVETRGGGLRFSEVEMPFRYREGIVTMHDALAIGPKLAIRLDGRIDPGSRRVTMRGVASPAYALSGFLDRVPVLGRLLTGDRGEGLLALTFRVSGTFDDPEIDVNPLSILAPGILRSVFEGELEDFGAGKDVVETPRRDTEAALERAKRLSQPD